MHTLAKTLLAASVAVTALSACGQKPTEAAGMPTPQVSVATPLKQNVTDWNDFVGRFEASQHVDVRARAGGFIQGVHFKDGQHVNKGQLLFTLDARPAQAALASAEADASVAQKAFERAEILMKEQAISRQDYDQRRATLDVADATLRARRLDVEFTRVVAPVSGTVSDRRVDAGNVIAGGTSAADVLTTIVATDDVYFAFDASEAQLLKYQREAQKNGGKVEIRLQDENEYRWDGIVDFSDNAINNGSGAVRMRALVKNKDGFLKPGMFGHARVEGSVEYVALMIPETAIVAQGANKVAYVVGANGAVEVKPLETGPLVDGLRVVRGGLGETDKVIVNGIQRAMPGATVEAKVTTITQTAELANSTAPKQE